MNDCLFFGSNFPIILFENEEEIIIKPIQFKFENENEKQIKQIASGYFSTIFLFENGKAIEYLNEEYSNSNQNPEKIQIENIQKVSVGVHNEAILTKEGNVFAKGTYINSKNPKEFINISSLIEDKNDRIIEDIVCGLSSIYLLTSNQNVYGIGSNYYGQFGVKLPIQTEKPILMMKNVSKIFSGTDSHSVFLLNSNQKLFGCGNNENDQLGLGKSKKSPKYTKIQKLTTIKIPQGKIIDIQCGNFHSIMLIEEEYQNKNENPKRKLYSTGDYRFTGLNKNQNTYEFTEIKLSLFKNDGDNILEISVGASHTLILTKKGKLIGFGISYYGQLANRQEEYHKTIPFQIKIPELRFNEEISNYHISCGENTSFLYYSPLSFSNLEEDLIKLFRRKEFCDISFKT
ncbi:claret isoform a [Anaeramoeba ignava]|uniref:Claret isoform a n=1 Tax=Anaeramoeba ignava TaxID=1746090 RepID=A0A9Q0L9Y3_ANAIG|nr:claret isoform a [Anaeramoeba ignava]